MQIQSIKFSPVINNVSTKLTECTIKNPSPEQAGKLLKQYLNFDSNKCKNSSIISGVKSYKDTIEYLKNLKKQNIKIEGFEQLDFNKLAGILYGLKTFKTISPADLPLFQNTVGNAIQIGCHNECLHCFLKAPKLAHEYDFAKTLIKWEDFKKSCTDIKQLNERLGFNILGKKFGGFFTILDADPISQRMFDNNGKAHDVSEIAETVYDNLKLKYIFSTAGWDTDDAFATKAAENICKKVQKHPEIFKEVQISIHPFHKYMVEANNAYKQYFEYKDKDSTTAQKYLKSYLEIKKQYVKRMANVLKTFLPAMNSGNFYVDPQYAVMTKGYLYSKKQTQELCKEILTELEEMCKQENLDCSFITKEKDINKNPLFHKSREISSLGRSRNKLSSIKFPSIFMSEKENNNTNLIINLFDLSPKKGSFFGEYGVESLVNNNNQGNKIFDNVIINIDTENGMDALLKKNGIISSNAEELNITNKTIKLLDRLQKLPNLKIRFTYAKEQPQQVDFIKKMEEKIEKTYHLKNFEYRMPSKTSDTSDSISDFRNIINSLPREKQIQFLKNFQKYIDINGKLGILTVNYPHFGYGNVKKRMIYFDNVKLNDNRLATKIR